ncbi:MAG: PKD domain-containing protein [Bacteroidota bacterium]
MKKIVFIFAFLLSGFAAHSQIFYTETFDGTACGAGSGCDPSIVAWTQVSLGGEGGAANEFFVSCTENGNAAGACGSGCGTDQSLHVGNVSTSSAAFIFCPTGDCGAAYDDSGPGEVTNKRAESPTINCTGQSNITIDFNYMEGDGSQADAQDNASLWYFDGATWTQIDPLASTSNTGCAPQGRWTAFSLALPASANNNPNVRIGFVWTNDGDGVAEDPSFAVDDITLTAAASAAPVASFTADQTSICAGDTVNFTNTSTGAPFTSINWTFAGGTPSSSTVANPSVIYSTPGTYTVTLSVVNASGNDTETITNYITVTDCTPSASFTTASTNICINDCIGFTNTSTGQGPLSYSWAFAGASPGTSTATNPSGICYSAVGTFTVTLTVTNPYGTDVATQNITVTTCTSPPVANFSPSATTICVGDQVNFTDLSTNGPTSWSWSFPGGTPATSTSQNPTITYNTPGTYSVTLNATNGTGTDDTTMTALITVQTCPPPTAAFSVNDSTICEGTCITITNSSTSATSYAWTFTGGTPPSSTSASPGTVCYNTAGSYTIQLIVSNSNGTDTVTHSVTVSPAPTVTASADTIINSGQTVPITATGSGSGSYTWSPPTGLSCTNCQSPNASPMVPTTYTVTYTENGCSVTDDVFVDVIIVEGIGVPNAFSPNGDGENDMLSVMGAGILSMHFIVYNRYGQLVFESTSQQLGWDGKHEGKDANTGVFVWYLEYTLVSGATGTLKGNVTLIR